MGVEQNISRLLASFPWLRPPAYVGFRLCAAALRIGDWLRPAPDGVPMPPPLLRRRVHGRFDRRSFLAVGRDCAQCVRDALKEQGRDFESFDSFLDFGCGSGRVLRYLRASGPKPQAHGTDIDPQAIAWCQRAMPWAQFTVAPHRPPLPYGDGAFDLIVGISVFTHLDEDFQNAWLAELARIARPGGHVLLTVHGPTAWARQLPEADLASLRARGFLFRVGSVGRFKADGLPDFYQGAYHTPEYVQRVWSRFLDIRAYVEAGVGRHQDLVVLQRR